MRFHFFNTFEISKFWIDRVQKTDDALILESMADTHPIWKFFVQKTDASFRS